MRLVSSSDFHAWQITSTAVWVISFSSFSRVLQFSWLDICGPGINRSADHLDAVTHNGYCVAFSLFILSSHGVYTLKIWLLEDIGAIWGGRVCRASRDLPVKQPETEGFCPLCSCFLFLVLFCVLTSFSLTILTFPNWQPVPTQGYQAALAPMWHAASWNWGFLISYDLMSIKQSRCHPSLQASKEGATALENPFL